MSQKISLDDTEYDLASLSDEGRKVLVAYQHATESLQDAINMQALLTRAKNSYVAELKSEMVKGKTGVDLGALFDDD